MMGARRPLIAGNWKMNGTIAEARALARDLRAIELPEGVDVVVCPPFTALAAVVEELAGSPIAVGAQNMHAADNGPHTGEISSLMLRELGVGYVIVGHSERRACYAENDDAVNLKVRAAIEAGIVPIVAVGETRDEHEDGQAIAKVTGQARIAFASVPPEDVARCVLAYEPIWAIGSGLSDTPANADRTIGEIRASVVGLSGARMLYGGSMKPENAAALMAESNIDGGLVGGASLDAASFAAIVRCALARQAA